MLPRGFLFSGLYAGIKASQKKDLGLIYSEMPCNWAGVFTNNSAKAHCVLDNLRQAEDGKPVHCVLVNSGNANACTGEAGRLEMIKTKKALAVCMNIDEDSILTASTGIIGKVLPGDLIFQNMPKLRQGLDSNPNDFAEAILTTDLVSKSSYKHCGEYSIFGVAKGSGMIHPNMATMLAFVVTDAELSSGQIKQCLRKACDLSFNQISVDGDTSTNDMVLLLANGQSKKKFSNKDQNKENADLASFQEALNEICLDLAKQIVIDGEGSEKIFQVKILGAESNHECRKIARGISSSMLVKAAIFGNDPNWGRIVSSAGQYAALNLSKTSLKLADIPLFNNGEVCDFDAKALSAQMKTTKEIILELNLDEQIPTEGIAWGCELSHDYVSINADYTT
jgi:glutamate N-acetyltransferase / amino-acid N-acetyltransferase